MGGSVLTMDLVIQLNKESLLPFGDSSSIIDSAACVEWLSGEKKRVYYAFLREPWIYETVRLAAVEEHKLSLDELDISNIVPVGSIEFVNYFLSKLNHEPIKAINIPSELTYPIYLKRNIWRGDKQEVYRISSENKSVFIKSDRYVKEFEPRIIRNGKVDIDGEIPDIPYLISEYMNYMAEWRVFVRHGLVLDCRQYLGPWGKQPDKEFIDLCVRNYHNCPDAYTLDIGENMAGKYSIIEVHNFISCGLYGFEHRSLLNMVFSGWRYELTGKKSAYPTQLTPMGLISPGA